MSADKMITSQKRKIDALMESLQSPMTNSSLRHRIIVESPAPQLTSPDERSPIRKKPRLSTDHDITIDLFPDSESDSESQYLSQKQKFPQSPSVEIKKQCNDYGTKYIKITSAASKGGKDETVKRELNDIGNFPPAGFNFSILQKKTGFGMNSGIIKKGYNGLGSHDKFVQPIGKSISHSNSLLVKKGAKFRGAVGKKNNNSGNSKAPPLPSLNGYLL